MTLPIYAECPQNKEQDREKDQDVLNSLWQSLGAIAVSPGESLPGDALVLSFQDGALALKRSGSKEKPVRVDLVGGKAGHRRKFGGGKGQDIAKAVGLNKGVKPRVLDATAGLGQDAFVLACLGCEITLVERSPVIAALLEDGLRRAMLEPEVAGVVERMNLVKQDSLLAMVDMAKAGQKYDVVYLDPMFPRKEKSALVKKEMKLFQLLLDDDLDADQLLVPSKSLANYRVVVKRPRLAPDLAGEAPTYRLEGKACRYDIYALKAFDK